MKRKLNCEFCKIWLPLILILIAGFYIAWLFVPPSAPDKLRIAAGSEGGAYYQYAQKYQQALKAEGVKLEMQTTAGSVESLQLLREGKVDLAFIQGGIGKNVPDEEGLHSIASLFYEPLWAFIRQPSGIKSPSDSETLPDTDKEKTAQSLTQSGEVAEKIEQSGSGKLAEDQDSTTQETTAVTQSVQSADVSGSEETDKPADVQSQSDEENKTTTDTNLNDQPAKTNPVEDSTNSAENETQTDSNSANTTVLSNTSKEAKTENRQVAEVQNKANSITDAKTDVATAYGSAAGNRSMIKTPAYLSELAGKRLAVGAEGSGTHALASRLLQDNGITAENSQLLSLGNEEAYAKLTAGELDAAFFVSAPQAETLSKLFAHTDVKIMSFHHHADAYTRHYPFLDNIELGEGSLNLQNNIPGEDTTVLAATAALVVGKNIHTDHVRLLTREALRIHSKPRLLEKAWQFPSKHHLEIPIHPDAEQYLQNGPSLLEKFLPFSLASRLDQLKIMLIPLLTLLFPLAKGVMPLYKWRIRSRTYRWYKDLNEIDRKLNSYPLAATQQAIVKIKKLHGELAQEVSVPLSHMSEFYSLRLHADHIQDRLQERKLYLLDKENADPTSITALETAGAVEEDDSIEFDNPISTSSNSKSGFSLLNTFNRSKTNKQAPDSENHANEDRKSGKPISAMKSKIPAIKLPDSFKQLKDSWNSTVKEEGVAGTDIEDTEDTHHEDDNNGDSVKNNVILKTPQRAAEKRKQANRIVRKHVAGAMALSAVPVPLVDVAALTGTQLNLLHNLCDLYGVDFNRKRAKSILLSMLSGSLPTTTLMGLSSMSKAIPGIGTLAGSATLSGVSGAIIYATGKVFIRHFESGGKLEDFSAKKHREAFQQNVQQ